MLNTRKRTAHENLWGAILVLLIVLFAVLLRAMATADGGEARSPFSIRGESVADFGHTNPASRASVGSPDVGALTR